MCSPDFFPKSLSSHGGLLIKELSNKFSGSVTHEVARYGGSDPNRYFLPNLKVNVLPTRPGGVCQHLQLRPHEYLLKNNGVVELLNWTPGKFNTQTHCIKERHFWDDMEG